MEQNALIFGGDCINKNAFHKSKRLVLYCKVDIR